MAFGFKFGKQSSEPVKFRDDLSKTDERELTEEELDEVTTYNPYPYGFPGELNNSNEELIIPKKGRR